MTRRTKKRKKRKKKKKRKKTKNMEKIAAKANRAVVPKVTSPQSRVDGFGVSFRLGVAAVLRCPENKRMIRLWRKVAGEKRVKIEIVGGLLESQDLKMNCLGADVAEHNVWRIRTRMTVGANLQGVALLAHHLLMNLGKQPPGAAVQKVVGHHVLHSMENQGLEGLRSKDSRRATGQRLAMEHLVEMSGS